MGYLVRRYYPWQSILWQAHEKYFLKSKEFQMNFNIEHAFKCKFLIKKFNFIENRPREIFIPKDIKLSAKGDKIKAIKEADENG